MKSKKKTSELVPIADALEGFDEFFSQSPVTQSPVKLQEGVWAEPQLYLLPFCVPQDKLADRSRSIKITEQIKLGDQYKERSFRVNPDPELGLPGSFDLEVMTGIYRLADEQMSASGIIPEFIELGSFRTFLSMIGKKYCGKYVKMTKESLRRLMSTMCISEGFFYSKPRDLYLAESFSFISSIEIAGEEDFNGNRYDRTRVKLHHFIRENLNASFRTLIDFEHLQSLRTDIAKPLALHIAYRIFKNKSSQWDPHYEWLAGRLAIRVYSDMRDARKQLKPALEELKETGIIDSWTWLGTQIKFVAGPRLVQMHQCRVVAKDAWVAHQNEKVRAEQLVIPVRTERENDPLVTICAEFAVKGWQAVSAKALSRGLTLEMLTQEAINRGHRLRSKS